MLVAPMFALMAATSAAAAVSSDEVPSSAWASVAVQERDDEGRERTVTGTVETIHEREDGRIGVAILPYAQMYVLHKSHPRFEELTALLKEAHTSKRKVRCTFRSYSGRIVTVEWAE